MTAAAIAAACGFLFSPGPEWDAVPLPTAAQVIEVPFDQIDAVCAGTPWGGHRFHYGCADPVRLVAYVPTWKTWPGTRACYDELTKRHEPDHLKGWRHP